MVQPRVVQERPAPWRSCTTMAELFTIRQAARVCEINPEALRRRVDRGTIQAAKGRDGTRRIPRSELERAGLWPGQRLAGQEVELRAELERARRELAALGARAEAEQQARERAELAHHQARAAQQTAEAQRADLAAELDELAAAGPIRAWRLRRQLRHAAQP
jgi:multidrug resistance efflux pump